MKEANEQTTIPEPTHSAEETPVNEPEYRAHPDLQEAAYAATCSKLHIQTSLGYVPRLDQSYEPDIDGLSRRDRQQFRRLYRQELNRLSREVLTRSLRNKNHGRTTEQK